MKRRSVLQGEQESMIMAMMRRQPCIVGPAAGGRKYDLLTWAAVAGLHNHALSPSLAPSLALRLIALVTARYN